MATLVASKPGTPSDHLQRFEKKIHEVRQTVSKLPGDDFYAELLATIKRPGWTTVAEGIFFEAIIDTMLARSRDLAELHQRLRKASAHH